MKAKNLLIYLIFFLFIIFILISLTIGFLFWRDLNRFQNDVKEINKTFIMRYNENIKSRDEEVLPVMNSVLQGQDRVSNFVASKIYSIDNKIENISAIFSNQFANISNTKVSIELINQLNDTLWQRIVSNDELLDFFLNRTDFIQRYVYNMSKTLREHLGYTSTNLVEISAIYPVQNESCGQCTFYLDVDEMTNETLHIKPFPYRSSNNTLLFPILDLSEGDMLFNATQTLKNYLHLLENRQNEDSSVIDAVITQQFSINNTLITNNQLISQLIDSNSNLTVLIENSLQYSSTKMTIDSELFHIDTPNLNATFETSNDTLFLSMTSSCSGIVFTLKNSAKTYKTSVDCVLDFIIHNNTVYDNSYIYQIGPITINILNHTLLPSDYNYLPGYIINTQSHLQNDNPSSISLESISHYYYKNTPISTLIELQSPLYFDNYQAKILLPAFSSDDGSYLYFTHSVFENRFKYQFDFSFYS